MNKKTSFALDAYYGRHFDKWMKDMWPSIRKKIPPALRYDMLQRMKVILQEASRVADARNLSDAQLVGVVIDDTQPYKTQTRALLSRMRAAYGAATAQVRRLLARILGVFRLPKV